MENKALMALDTVMSFAKAYADISQQPLSYGELREHEKTIRDFIARAAQKPVAQWRTIDSAPKDGTKFLAYAPECEKYHQCYMVDWRDHQQQQSSNLMWKERPTQKYTHWMPLPPTPATNEKE